MPVPITDAETMLSFSQITSQKSTSLLFLGHVLKFHNFFST